MRVVLLVGLLGSGAVAALAQTAAQNPFGGSVPEKAVTGVLPLSLQDAIDRGLKQNLGLLLSDANRTAARGQRLEALSALLPHVTAAPFIADSKINLGELGLTHFGNVAVPPSVGPFSYADARVSVDQPVLDLKAINNSRASREGVKSAQYSYQDARDLVVLAVGYAYLQAIADEARIQTAAAQVQTAQAIYNQASDQVTAGTSPAIDGLRARVELQTRQQQLIQARNNFAIQKLTVARVIGLAPGQEFDLTDKSPYQPFEGISVEEALQRAYASRSDYQAAMADVHAAEYAKKAAAAEYAPSLGFGGNYGVGGARTATATQVFNVQGTLTIPIFLGGSVRGDILQADARLAQSREKLENLRAQIDTDVRTALLNLQSSSDQVAVARSNVDLAEQTLMQASDRFAAGVSDTVEVVQSQETRGQRARAVAHRQPLQL